MQFDLRALFYPGHRRSFIDRAAQRFQSSGFAKNQIQRMEVAAAFVQQAALVTRRADMVFDPAGT